MRVYWTSVEYKYLKGSADFDKLKGGTVYAFVSSKDVQDALKKYLSVFEDLKLKTTDIEFIKPYDTEMDWADKKQTSHFLNLYNEAQSSSDVILDDFYAYEKED